MYEGIADQLQAHVQSGDLLYYWSESSSTVPLLYLDGVDYFPPQVNAIYNYRLEGEITELRRRGFWGDELAAPWLGEADYILVGEETYQGFVRKTLGTDRYRLVLTTDPVLDCRVNSPMLLFEHLDL
jgi:hypothetical protein